MERDIPQLKRQISELKQENKELRLEITNLQSQLPKLSVEERNYVREVIKQKRREADNKFLQIREKQAEVARLRKINQTILPRTKPIVKLQDLVVEMYSDGVGNNLSPTPEQIHNFDAELRTLSGFRHFSRNNYFPKVLNPYWIPKYNRILLHNIPLSVHISYHQFFNYYAGNNIISVGSGFGHIERLFSPFWTLDKNVYLIDPSPDSFSPKLAEQVRWPPNYPYLNDLVTSHPEVIGNNGLFIMWANPGYSYDVEAIQILQPRTILVCYEQSGVAGSEEFFEGLWRNNYTTIGLYTSDDIIDYLKAHETGYTADQAQFKDALELLVRNDIQLLPFHPESGHYYDYDDIAKINQLSSSMIHRFSAEFKL
jgi:hypothetical protein